MPTNNEVDGFLDRVNGHLDFRFQVNFGGDVEDDGWANTCVIDDSSIEDEVETIDLRLEGPGAIVRWVDRNDTERTRTCSNPREVAELIQEIVDRRD